MKPGDPAASPSEDHELPALAWLRRAGAEEELLHEIRRKVKRRRTRRLAAVGAMAVVLGVGMFTVRAVWPARATSVTPVQTVATTATVLRPNQQVLPDGSTVEFKDGARIAVDFSGTFRRVTLVAGEAHFQVAKDKSRPFIVTAGRTEVQAVGTAFSVELGGEAVDVLVTEGRVQVDSGAEEDRPAFVDSGSRCVVPTGLTPRVETVSNAVAGERLAWRVPQLEFSRTPLSEVVELMNRYAPADQTARFEIADAELKAIKLTGFLRADNTEGLVRLLENSFHVRSERVGERIVLRRS